MNIDFGAQRLPPPINIKVKPGHVAHQLLITWNPVHTKKTVFYNIYRGISKNGIFYKINKQPLQTNEYHDTNVNRNPNVIYWYKISSLYEDENGSLIEGKLSQAVQYQVTTMNKWFVKINERNMWILKNTGVPFDLYTRKYEGELCPDCYDPARGRAGQNSCRTCFGTGFVGGYEPQVQIYARLKPAEESLDISQEAYTYNSIPGAWTITPIKIKNRDLLIAQDGMIYVVKSTYVTQAEAYLFHQELKMVALEPEDELYNMKRETLKPAY